MLKLETLAARASLGMLMHFGDLRFEVKRNSFPDRSPSFGESLPAVMRFPPIP